MKTVNPPEEDFFWEPDGNAKAEIKIKRSLFIGQLFLCKNTSDARLSLAGAESENRGANHNCWAYCLDPKGAGPGTEHFSDDGEPAGTAGRPILAAIRQSGMVNVMVVVTRYFGGVKLGVRGLIEAYGQAAEDVISRTQRARRTRVRRLTVRFPCDAAGDVTRLLDACEGTALAWRYGVDTGEAEIQQETDVQGADAQVEAEFRASVMPRVAAAFDELRAKKRIRFWSWLPL